MLVIQAAERYGLSGHQVAAPFGIGFATAIRWLRQYRTTGSAAAGQMGGGVGQEQIQGCRGCARADCGDGRPQTGGAESALGIRGPGARDADCAAGEVGPPAAHPPVPVRRRHLHRQAGRRKDGNAWVFPRPRTDDQPVQNEKRVWQSAKKAAGLPMDTRINDLRHSFASAWPTRACRCSRSAGCWVTLSFRPPADTPTMRRSGCPRWPSDLGYRSGTSRCRTPWHDIHRLRAPTWRCRYQCLAHAKAGPGGR